MLLKAIPIIETKRHIDSMSNILITGATGNVGFEVIRFLFKQNHSHRLVAGVRNIEKAKVLFKEHPNLAFVHFDFEDVATFNQAFEKIDRVFLLRPPHISDVEKYFKPLMIQLQKSNIHEVVFLSVQGAEKSKIIPHNKIERLITSFKLDYIFLRPSYFMQNLTTTLLEDIKTKRQIVLPAGKAKFNWVDIENIAEVAALVLERFNEHKNQAFEITGLENENFEKATLLLNTAIKSPIKYHAVSPLRFFNIKKQEGMKQGLIVVMLLLHYLPRWQKEPKISNFYERLTGKKPTDLKSFIAREKNKFEQTKGA